MGPQLVHALQQETWPLSMIGGLGISLLEHSHTQQEIPFARGPRV